MRSEMTKKKIQRYEAIRQSGVTNMFMVNTVVSLSSGVLNREDCIDIMENYEKYIKQFNIERG